MAAFPKVSFMFLEVSNIPHRVWNAAQQREVVWDLALDTQTSSGCADQSAQTSRLSYSRTVCGWDLVHSDPLDIKDRCPTGGAQRQAATSTGDRVRLWGLQTSPSFHPHCALGFQKTREHLQAALRTKPLNYWVARKVMTHFCIEKHFSIHPI